MLYKRNYSPTWMLLLCLNYQDSCLAAISWLHLEQFAAGLLQVSSLIDSAATSDHIMQCSYCSFAVRFLRSAQRPAPYCNEQAVNNH